MLQTAHLNEGLEFSEFCEPLEDTGLSCFGRRSLSRHKRVCQSIVLSIAFHVAVISAFVLAPRSSCNIGTPWLEVRLVSLGGGEASGEAENEGKSGGASTVAGPVGESQMSVAFSPAEEKKEAIQPPKQDEPRPVVKQAAVRSRPAGKPKAPVPTTPLQSSSSPVEPVSPSLAEPDHGLAKNLPGPSNSPNGFAEPQAGGGGTAGGHHGRGNHGGRGGGAVDAEFGAANGPRFAHRIMPQYPRVARQLGKEAVVVLRVTIDEAGRPISVEALKKAGNGFDEEAVRAVKESHFHPAKREGRPVLCRAILPVRFQLKGSD